MRVNNTLLALAGIALLAILAWGIEQATIAPLQTGEIYPPYSSLRSDPLGARALYESLAALPGIEVERRYKQRGKLQSSDAMLVLGVEPVAWSGVGERTLQEYEKLIQDGGRLVIAFLPVRTPRKIPEKREVEKRWNVKLDYSVRGEQEGEGMPRESALYFEAGPEWRRVAGHVAIERGFGKGSIVLAADTFPLSNEGLREARDAAFIAALTGPATRIVFDENHFGVVETGSVTKLMHKYHLEGAIAVLALAAALFLWRSASSFLPPRSTAVADAVTGRDSLEGMSALLFRAVKPKDLLDVCYAEWTKSAGRERRVASVEEEVRRHKENPVEGYNAAAKALAEKHD